MSNPQNDLDYVGKLPREIMFKLVDLVDESIITTHNIAEIKTVLGDIDADVEKITRVFYNMVLCKSNPEAIIGLLNSTSTLTDNEKNALKDAAQRIHDKVDVENVVTGRLTGHLELDAVSRNWDVWEYVSLFAGQVALADKNAKNRAAFDGFKAAHTDDPEFRDKFVVFVNGKLRGSGDRKEDLVKSMYERFGNVPMHVGLISNHERIVRLCTPRFKRIEV